MGMARRMAAILDDSGALWPVAESNQTTRYPHMMPLLPDVDLDADGLSDNTEDPNRNGLVDSGETNPDSSDSDGDSTPDGAEVRLGLDPLDPLSVFHVAGVAETDGHFLLTWPSVPGTFFDVTAADDLRSSTWSNLETNLPADSGTTTVYDTGLPGSGSKMFRIWLRPDAP